MKKNIDYYMGLNYPITINSIPEDEGGGYCVKIPLLGEYSFVAEGDNLEEALANLENLKKEILSKMIDKGINIPEPIEEKVDDISGKFILRIPKSLHATLRSNAQKEGVSLNQYINYLITSTNSSHQILDDIKGLFDWFCSIIEHYNFQISGNVPKFHAYSQDYSKVA